MTFEKVAKARSSKETRVEMTNDRRYAISFSVFVDPAFADENAA
jgi:hypothetical protein